MCTPLGLCAKTPPSPPLYHFRPSAPFSTNFAPQVSMAATALLSLLDPFKASLSLSMSVSVCWRLCNLALDVPHFDVLT